MTEDWQPVLGYYDGPPCTCHCELRRLTAEVVALKIEREAEMNGILKIRADCGARDNECFPDFVQRLVSEIAALKEQLAAREAVIAKVFTQHIPDLFDERSVICNCAGRNAFRSREFGADLRAHEARLLEEVERAMSGMNKLEGRVKFYDYLKEQIATRRTK